MGPVPTCHEHPQCNLPQEVLTNLGNARYLCIFLNDLKPVDEAASRQIVCLVHDNLDTVGLTGPDIDTAGHIQEKHIGKYAMKGDRDGVVGQDTDKVMYYSD